MPRGASYLLSKSDEAALSRINPKHPRIKRSAATKLALAAIVSEFVEPTNGTSITITKSPPVVRLITRRISYKYLRGKSELKLDARNIWRIYFRKTFGKMNVVQSSDQSLLHRAIYIQRRHNTAAEDALGRQKRIKSSSTNPLGNDLPTIRSVTTIDQTGSPRLIYTCTDLHSRHHGSIHHKDIANKNILYEAVGISNKTLSLSSTGRRCVAKHDDVTVAFEGAAYFKNLRKVMSSKCKVDLAHFEYSLASHVLSCGKTRDIVRCNGNLDPTQYSVNIRITFFFGRIQNAGNLLFDGATFPGVNVKSFESIPPALKNQLNILFQDSTLFTKSWIKESFPNAARNAKCAGHLNAKMGFPKSTSLFEYFDVIICRNTVLRKHMDEKNDHRKGYNICTVYSYCVMLNGEEYKISIIMTTRTTVGSACDKAGMHNHLKQHFN